MEFSHGYFTHKGHVRSHNEDCLYVPDPGDDRREGLYMVADGMGGYNAGDVASRTVVRFIQEHFDASKAKDLSGDSIEDYLGKIIAGANQQVFEMAMENAGLSGMGTTLTLAWFAYPKAYIAHVGDSRCYLIHEGQASQVTRDHSLVQQLVDAGQIHESEMYTHPQKNIITKAIGTDPNVSPDIFHIVIHEEDTLLLCTDGFINHVNIKDYVSWFDSMQPLDRLAADLGQKALDGGGKDNITLVLVRPVPHGEGRED